MRYEIRTYPIAAGVRVSYIERMTNPGDDLLTLREVCSFFGGTETPLDSSTIYRWIRKGVIPPAIRMSAKHMRWKRSDLQKALDAMPRNRGGDA